jgi:hypothetical protein
MAPKDALQSHAIGDLRLGDARDSVCAAEALLQRTQRLGLSRDDPRDVAVWLAFDWHIARAAAITHALCAGDQLGVQQRAARL